MPSQGPRLIHCVVKGFVSALTYLSLISVLASCQSAPPRWDQEEFLNALNVHSAVAADTVYLTGEQVQEDLKFLGYALENIYGGWEFLTPQFRRKVRQEVEQIQGPSTREQLEWQLERLAIFSEHKDGHLGLVRPLVLKDPDALNRTVVHKYLQRQKFWRLEQKQLAGGRALWITLYEFPFIEDNPEWDRFVAALSHQVERAEQIVVDLRINPGGALISSLALAKMLSSGVPLPDLGDSYHVITPEAQLGRNYQMGVPAQINLRDFQKRGERAVTYPIDKAAYEKIKVPFLNIEQPLLILTSPYCASSCEVLALLLENHPRALVMGQNTAGIFHFHTPIQLKLPNSELLVAFPTGVLRLRDGRFLELSGLKPALPVSNLAELDRFVEFGFQSIKERQNSRPRWSY